jgi:endonuclease III
MDEKAKKIQVYLNNTFPIENAKTDLVYPKNNKFALLIVILLSANTTDKQVNKVSPLLFKKANNPDKMLKLGISQIRNIIKSVGLASKKSEYIIKLSRILVKKYNSKIPETKNELVKLPGVGNKIAGVYLINATGLADFPVDTHIRRCAIAWGLTKNKDPTKISEDLKKIFPKTHWVKIRYQMIMAGRARVC